MKNMGFMFRALPRFRGSAAELTWTLLARGSGAPLALIANIGLARILGASQFGRFATLLSAGLVAGGIAIYGTAPIFTREIAAQTPSLRREAFKRVAWWASTVIIPLTVVVTALVCAWLFWWSGAQDVGWQQTLAVVLLIPLSGLAVLLNSILAGLGRVSQGQLLGNGWRNGWLLAGVSVLLLMGSRKPADALWVQVASYLILAALGVWLVRRALGNTTVKALPVNHRGSHVRPNHGDWWRSATAFFGFSLGTMLFIRLDLIVINALAGDTQAGYFGAAARLVQVIQLPGLVLLAWLQPKLAREVSQGRWLQVRKTYLTGLGGVFVMTGALAVFGWFFAPSLMKMFGKDFSYSVDPFRWLTLGYLVWAMAVPSLALLTMSGGEKPVALAIWAQLVIALAIGLLVIKRYGAHGGAWAWAAGLIGANAFILAYGLIRVIREARLAAAREVAGA